MSLMKTVEVEQGPKMPGRLTINALAGVLMVNPQDLERELRDWHATRASRPTLPPTGEKSAETQAEQLTLPNFTTL